jgi:Mn-containing catalase
MSHLIKELLVEELQHMLDAENQLTTALPKMAKAAHYPKLKEGFEKHLQQTQMHIQRLNTAFDLLGTPAQAKPCAAMKGLVEAGESVVQGTRGKNALVADLALIGAAQAVEHHEIASYGTAKTLARQMDEIEVARLLTQTLGEEEATDYLLTEIAKPLLQDAALEGHGVGASTSATTTGRQRQQTTNQESARAAARA